jgi:imidazolonepropionase
LESTRSSVFNSGFDVPRGKSISSPLDAFCLHVNRLLVRGARQLLTLRGPSSPRRGKEVQDVGAVEDGAILTENGIVSEAGPTRRIENLVSARNARVIDATNKVVLPGFVDASTNLLSAARAGHRAPSRIRLTADLERYRHWFAQQGTTTLGARFTTRKDLALLRTLENRPPAITGIYSGEDADALEDEAVGGSQVEIYCPAGGLDLPKQLLFTAARRLGFGVRVVGPGAEETGLRGDAHLIENPTFRHRSALEAVTSSATMVLLTPLSADRALARPFLDAGGALALATGFGPALPRTPSIPFVIAWAVLEMGLSVEEAISSVTVNGAQALGLARTAGTLEAGKAADFVVFDCPDYRDIATQPGTNLVSMVVKGGHIVNREPT